MNDHEFLWQAGRIHGVGHQLELSGNFNKAHVAFGGVLFSLDKVDITPENMVPVAALRAATLREDGFTSLRHALMDAKPELITAAEARLQEARAITSPFITGDQPLTSRASRSEIFSIHASTEGYLGRLVVAKQIVSGELTLRAPATDEQRQAQHWFGLAYKTALGGNSANTGASIAITAARTEVANGSPSQKLEWLRRVGVFVLLQETEGLRLANRVKAVKTVAKHSDELKSRTNAMNAAIDWQRI